MSETQWTYQYVANWQHFNVEEYVKFLVAKGYSYSYSLRCWEQARREQTYFVDSKGKIHIWCFIFSAWQTVPPIAGGSEWSHD